MPTFTIYSLGDVASYWSMLNGVAMIFGLTGFWASAGLAGSLILLVLVLVHFLSVAGGGQGGHSPVLGPLYLGATFVFMSINSSVAIQDIYTGNIIKVDNIPLIISLPSSLMTTAAYKVFQTVDTAFTTVNGSYMSVGTNGMESPLKLLLSLRKGFSTSAPNLALSMKVFVQSCTSGGDSNFNKQAYETLTNPVTHATYPNSLAYLTTAGNFNSTGLTFDFPSGSTAAVATNCTTEAATLLSRSAAYMAAGASGTNSVDGNPNTVIVNNMGNNVTPAGAPYQFADAQQSIQTNVIGNLHTAGQGAQDFMQNMLYYDVINAGMDCAGVSLSAEASNACWTENAIIRQGLEKWKADAASSGTFFSKMMAQSIVFLQLMFFGFSPIMLIVCLFMGEKSLGLFAKYLVFGVWTVSWLPFTAVIEMYIQNQIAARVAATSTISIGGITPGNMSSYYDMISGNIGLAADLMGMVPMLSLGLLTGSAMAMAGMAKHFDGMASNSNASGVISPDLQKVGVVHDESGRSAGNAFGTWVNGAEGVAPTFGVTHNAASTIQSASQTATSASKALTENSSNLQTAMHNDSTATAEGRSAEVNLSKALSHQASETKKFDESLSNTQGMNVAQKAALSAAVSASTPWPIVKAQVQALATDEASKSAAETFTKNNSDSYSTASAANRQLSIATGNAISAVTGHSDATTRASSKSAASALNKLDSASNSFTTAASNTSQASITTQVNANQFAALVDSDPIRRDIAKDAYYNGMSDVEQSIIDGRAQGFISKLGMDSNNAQYAAIGEMLARKMTSGDTNAAATFDALNAAASGPNGIGSVSDGTGVSAQGLSGQASRIVAPSLPTSTVGGAAGYSAAKAQANMHGIEAGAPGLTGAQVASVSNGLKSGEVGHFGSSRLAAAEAEIKTGNIQDVITDGKVGLGAKKASGELENVVGKDAGAVGNRIIDAAGRGAGYGG